MHGFLNPAAVYQAEIAEQKYLLAHHPDEANPTAVAEAAAGAGAGSRPAAAEAEEAEEEEEEAAEGEGGGGNGGNGGGSDSNNELEKLLAKDGLDEVLYSALELTSSRRKRAQILQATITEEAWAWRRRRSCGRRT